MMRLGKSETIVENELDGALWRYFFKREDGHSLVVNVRCSRPAEVLAEALHQQVALALLRSRGRPQAAAAARHAPSGVATMTLRVSPVSGTVERFFTDIPSD
jgi:hypothetical protein